MCDAERRAAHGDQEGAAMNRKPGLVPGAIIGVALVLLFMLLPIGSWLSGLSDSLWWMVLPWFLIIAFWAYLIARYRKRRGPWGSAQGGSRDAAPDER
jgi:hypothetical protein